MQYRVSGTVGEMVVDLVISAPVREVGRSKKLIEVVTDEGLEAQVVEAKRVLGERLASQAVAMIDVLARQNKGGKMRFSRAVREVWLPLVHALEGSYTREQLEHGMSVALERGKPVPYAKAVARSWEGEPVKGPVRAERKYKVV